MSLFYVTCLLFLCPFVGLCDSVDNTLYKRTYENANFPYWDAVWKYEDYWKANWNKFRQILSSLKGVISDGKMIGISRNLSMSNYVPNNNVSVGASNNNIQYRCTTGSSFNTYNYNTLTPGQKIKAIELWGETNGRNPRYFACAQGCTGECLDTPKKSSLVEDNEYVYITKKEYNKSGFPYAIFVNMSQ